MGVNYNDSIRLDSTPHANTSGRDTQVTMNDEKATFDGGTINQLNVNTSGGSNGVRVNEVLAGVTVNVNGGMGSDDLVFVGSHGLTGLERLILGSVSERIVREAHCPVMVVRPKTYEAVDLMNVIRYDHERKPYTPPHRFSYVDRQAITRPNDWPIS